MSGDGADILFIFYLLCIFCKFCLFSFSFIFTAMSNSGDEVSDDLNKTLSKQLAERTSTAQEFFDIKVIELSDNPNTPGKLRTTFLTEA